MLARAALAALLGRKRCFLDDAKRIMASAPPVVVVGMENIPDSGAFLVLANHYTRPGLGGLCCA